MVKTGRERLRDYIHRHGYKQRELAHLLGLADAHLSQILNARRVPGLPIAVRIEDTTGIPVSSWVPSRVGSRRKKKPAKPAMVEVSSTEI